MLTTDFLIRQDGQEFRAPDANTLRQWAKEGRIRPDSEIFDPALNRWSRARDTSELASVYQSGANINKLAKNYRQLVLGVGAQILIAMVFRGMPELSLILLPAIIATIGAVAYYAYRTAEALESDAAWLWAVAMLVPCINIITLLVLSSKATAVCRAQGIEVGFLGPKV